MLDRTRTQTRKFKRLSARPCVSRSRTADPCRVPGLGVTDIGPARETTRTPYASPACWCGRRRRRRGPRRGRLGDHRAGAARLEAPAAGSDVLALLAAAVAEAREVLEASARIGLDTMATTLVARSPTATWSGWPTSATHGRTCSGGGLRRLTRDHTWVQELLGRRQHHGGAGPDAPLRRSVVTRALDGTSVPNRTSRSSRLRRGPAARVQRRGVRLPRRLGDRGRAGRGWVETAPVRWSGGRWRRGVATTSR